MLQVALVMLRRLHASAKRCERQRMHCLFGGLTRWQ